MRALPSRRPLPLAALSLVATLALAVPSIAQEPVAPDATEATAEGGADAAADPAAEAAADPAAEGGRDAYETRGNLGGIIRRHASELATVLALEPSLLANEAFLADYPDLAAFVAEHPEVARNPRFYLAEFPVPQRGPEIFEPLLIFGVFIANLLAVIWLVRTVLEQRRWSRLARTQSEVHNKILERFGTSDALLEYMRSPAGSRFLESAPIPIHPDSAAPASPVGRAILSVQAGVVLAAGALGLLLVSGRFDAETSQGLFSLGVIALCVGVGFVASALVSIVLSRRLGAWPGSAQAPADLAASRLVE